MIEKSRHLINFFLTLSFMFGILCGFDIIKSGTELKRMLKSTKLSNITNLLNLHGPFTEEEYKEMQDETKKVLSLLEDSIKSKKNDTKSHEQLKNVVKSQIEAPKDRNHTDSLICKTCLWTFSKYHNLLEKKYGLTLFNEFLSMVCAIGLDYKICKDAIFLYSPTVVDSLIEHYLDAEYICTKSKICKFSHYYELDPDEYAKELLKDKPPKKIEKIDDSNSILKVLHVTDIHTDLLYEEGSTGLCAQPLCCRKEVGKAKSKMDYAGPWGYQGKCDIPLKTLDLFVEKVVNEIKPDIIVWTGDNPPHNPWNENSQEIYNITQVFVDLLYKKYQYKGVVFPSLGNHEEYITDQYNPFDTSREKEFLQKMGDIYKVFLGKEEYENFVKYGFYTTKYANSNLRIISINCFLCDVLNFFLIRDPTDPGMQFEWLEKVLRQAERDGEYAFIIGHIPPGDSTYLSECSKRYNAIVDRFSNIIRGQFYGHTHYDEFRIITEYFNESNIAGIILTAPSLTSYSWKNPSFRVYEVDSKTSIIKDYHQYRLNLTEANLNPDRKPDWKIAYTAKEVNLSFNKFYQAFSIKDFLDFEPFRITVDKIIDDKDSFDFIIDSFYAQGVEKLSYINNKRLPHYISCRFNESIFDDYLKCTGYRTWDYVEYVNRFIESLSGKWYVKITEDIGKHQKFLGAK